MRRTLIVVLLLPLTALAGGYRWTDEDGKVHFSDQPPPGQDGAEAIELKGPKPIGQGESVRRTEHELEQMRREREKREREAAHEEARKQKLLQRKCRNQARRLSRMKNGRVRYRQPDGSYEGVDEDTHQARIRELEQWVEQNCN